MASAGQWRVLKVKGFDEVVPGEHWRSYGFRYQEAAPKSSASQ